MKMLELKEKSKNELESLLSENKAELMKLKFKVTAGSLNNVRNLRVVKKNIARVLTALNLLK